VEKFPELVTQIPEHYHPTKKVIFGIAETMINHNFLFLQKHTKIPEIPEITEKEEDSHS
jgi:hypothetical protein